MMGGLQGKIALTAYVAIALTEADENSAVSRAIDYLESELDNIGDAYTMAITTYALELAQSDRSEDAYQKLMELAQEDETYKLTEKDKADLKKTLDELYSSLNENPTVHIWVGNNDYFIRKISFSTTIDSEGDKADVNLEIITSNINEPVTIIVPADAEEFDLNEWYNDLMGSYTPYYQPLGYPTPTPGTPEIPGAGFGQFELPTGTTPTWKDVLGIMFKQK